MKLTLNKREISASYIDDHYNLGGDYNFDLIHDGAIVDIKLEARIINSEIELTPKLKQLEVKNAVIVAEHWTDEETEKLKDLGFTTINDAEAELVLPKNYFSNWSAKFEQLQRTFSPDDEGESLYIKNIGFDLDFCNQQINIQI